MLAACRLLARTSAAAAAARGVRPTSADAAAGACDPSRGPPGQAHYAAALAMDRTRRSCSSRPMAKLFASDVAVRGRRRGQLLHGGWATPEEFAISRHWSTRSCSDLPRALKPSWSSRLIARGLLGGWNAPHASRRSGGGGCARRAWRQAASMTTPGGAIRYVASRPAAPPTQRPAPPRQPAGISMPTTTLAVDWRPRRRRLVRAARSRAPRRAAARGRAGEEGSHGDRQLCIVATIQRRAMTVPGRMTIDRRLARAVEERRRATERDRGEDRACA